MMANFEDADADRDAFREWNAALHQRYATVPDADADEDAEEDIVMGGRRMAMGAMAPNDAKLVAVLLCDVLGALCIALNAFVIVALVRNRRRVLVNVFYVLVLHCAVVDLIRGGCLIAWGMPHLLINHMRSIHQRLFALKLVQFTLVVLRSCNLLTIFNLLVFTTNEFIVIKYPLHYRRYFRRRTVLAILALCWLISLLFGVGSVFSNFFESAHSVMVHSGRGSNASAHHSPSAWFRRRHPLPDPEVDGPEEELLPDDPEADEDDDTASVRFGEAVTRRQMAGLSINVLCMLMIFVLCYVCLFTVLICYGKILRTIRQFQKCGGSSGQGGARRLIGTNGAATTTMSQKGSTATTTTMTRTGSIYHKRSVHQQRTHQQHQAVCTGGSATVAGGTPVTLARSGSQRQRPQRQRSVGDCASSEQQQRLASGDNGNGRKKVSMPGTPQSQASQGAYCGRCPNCVANAQAEADMAQSRRCNSHRKWRSHLMSRHKYLIVIGTVLFVDVLFLFPYSGIQMVALLHLNNLLATSHLTTLIRWGLQILIGVHSVCQPLCYFRMTEFRRLACCLGAGHDARRFGGSGSSVVPGGGFSTAAGGPSVAASRVARSGARQTSASVKTSASVTRHGYDHREKSAVPPLGKDARRSIVLGTLAADGTPPPEAKCAMEPLEMETPERKNGIVKSTEQIEDEADDDQRTQWVNPSVDGRARLMIAQRRRWTRNLSLLCKEEGEELELYMAAAERGEAEDGRRGGTEGGDLIGKRMRDGEAEEEAEGGARERLLKNNVPDDEDLEQYQHQPEVANSSVLGRIVGWMRKRSGRRRRRRMDDETEADELPTRNFLGAEPVVVQFRRHRGMDDKEDQHQKLSGLSGLRSNSVFTNDLASQRPSAQWEPMGQTE